ncbi:MAG: TLD domain-containing protein [archaeon]|nr:TLD domain-containing protein [archaeon]
MEASKDTEDISYLNEFKGMDWFNFTGYADIEKIKARIPSFKYLVESIKGLDTYCTDEVFNHVMSKENLLKSENAKELGRHGVPPKRMRDFILKLCFTKDVNKESYTYFLGNSLHNFRVEDMGDYIPYMTGKKTFEESLPVHYLNEEGVYVLKEILWMFQIENQFMEFSPNIIGITSILLLFLKKEEVLRVMRALIKGNYSYTETSSIRFHFRFNYNENSKIVSSLTEAMVEISKKSGRVFDEHLHQINFATQTLYEDIIFNFMLKHLNFYGIIRFLPFFLLEGTKAMYRLVYALVKTLKDDLIKIDKPEEVLDKCAELMSKAEGINEIFQMSLTFGLNRDNNKYEFQPDAESGNPKDKKFNYYVPKFNKKSQILKDKEILKLWSIFTPELRNKDANKVYDSSVDGYSLQGVIDLSVKVNENNYLMLILETADDEAFGFLISGVINLTDGKFKRPSTSMIIKRVPDGIETIEPNEGAEDVLYVDNECIMFGNGPNGPTIRIDKDFNIGFCNEGGCFNTPLLTKAPEGKFQIKKFEVFELTL